MVALENPAKGLGALFVKLSLLACSLQAVRDCGSTLIALLHSTGRAIKHFRVSTPFKEKSCSRSVFLKSVHFFVLSLLLLGNTPALLVLLRAGLVNLFNTVFKHRYVYTDVNVT